MFFLSFLNVVCYGVCEYTYQYNYTTLNVSEITHGVLIVDCTAVVVLLN